MEHLRNCDIEKVYKEACESYRSGQFYCSEAVVKTIRDNFKLDFDNNIIKVASGFPVGIGGSGCTCGALTGGIIALGMIFGRTEAYGSEVDHAMMLSQKLHDYFKTTNKSTCCRTITKDMTLGTPNHKKHCINITGDTAREVARMINTEFSK